jgi:hypothetical protein
MNNDNSRADALTDEHRETLKFLINEGRNAKPKHLGGYGENMVYLTQKMYAALSLAATPVEQHEAAPADAAAAPADGPASFDGDSEETRAAFREYDACERVSTRTSWQIWRDACAWQARAAAPLAQIATRQGLTGEQQELIEAARRVIGGGVARDVGDGDVFFIVGLHDAERLSRALVLLAGEGQ